MTGEYIDLLHTRKLRSRLAAGKAALGAWLGITDPLALEALAADCDLDWGLVDMEHAGMGWNDLKMVMLGWKGSEVPLFIRVPSHDTSFLARVLDLGASGVVVPFVNTAEDAARVVAACRYPPAGTRGNAPRRVSRHYTQTAAYNATANQDVFVMVQIEHADAVRNVEEIARTPGLDAIFIGPGDLSFSLGIPLQWEHPKLQEAINTVIETGKRAGIPVAMAVDDAPEDIHAMVKRGIQLPTVGLDWGFMRTAMKQQTAAVRALLGE